MRGTPFPGVFPPRGQGFTIEQQKWLAVNIPPPSKPAAKPAT